MAALELLTRRSADSDSTTVCKVTPARDGKAAIYASSAGSVPCNRCAELRAPACQESGNSTRNELPAPKPLAPTRYETVHVPNCPATPVAGATEAEPSATPLATKTDLVGGAAKSA